MKTTNNKPLEPLQPIDQEANKFDPQNPNPKLTEKEINAKKKKQLISIIVLSILLAVAITLTVLTYTVFKK